MADKGDIFRLLFDIEGKVGIVTGGSSGIGLSMAKALAQTGVKIAIVNRTVMAGEKAAAEIREHGGIAASFPADVTKKDNVEAVVEAIENEMGAVDILVNCAGINIRKKAVEFGLNEWQQILDTNLTGTFLACQAVGRRMLARGRGRIVNISSVASAIGLEDRAPYCASKGGVSQLTKVLAIEWAPYGVTVNAIGPGYMNTPLIANLMKQPGFQERVRSQVPLGRVGETEDLYGILFVLCSKAGAYITGQTVYIDGGWSIW
jgi:NAD(P)-dependent dehydrogenase (short-subunit alcohol dehydrogenase family)